MVKTNVTVLEPSVDVRFIL